MKIIGSKLHKLKELEEYRDQYLEVNESYRLEQIKMKQTNNSTTIYLLNNFNYEKREELIDNLKLSGCPENHIETISSVHKNIHKEFQDNFENHKVKTAIFDFYNLVNEAVKIIDNNSDGNDDNKIKKFLKLGKRK